MKAWNRKRKPKHASKCKLVDMTREELAEIKIERDEKIKEHLERNF